MPTDDLEREIRDLSARIFAAGRRSGERAASDRIVAIVRQAAGPFGPEPGSETSDFMTPVSDQSPAADLKPASASAESSVSPHASPTAGVSGTGPAGERLPPYWRPR